MHSLGREPQELDGGKEIEPLKGATGKGGYIPPLHIASQFLAGIRSSLNHRDTEGTEKDTETDTEDHP